MMSREVVEQDPKIMSITPDDIQTATVLIADDERHNVMLMESILRQGGFVNVNGTTDARHVLPLYLEHQPDLLVLDLNMPHLDGFAVMRQLTSRIPPSSYFPILVVTAEMTPETKHEALVAGAKDFLTKPLDTTEVLLRIRNLLTARLLHRRLEAHAVDLEEKVRGRTCELEAAHLEVLQRLALAAEYRDDETGEHTWRVGRVSAMLTERLGWPLPRVELMRLAAPLHDLGKIGIPDTLLLSTETFRAEDLDVMKRHVTIGAKILSGSRSPLLQLAEVIALTHHERWDGTGYMRLKKDQIPLPGRIVTVADVFDALTHERPYKDAWPIERARAEIASQAGKQFDPQVVEMFLAIIDREGERLLTRPRGEEPPSRWSSRTRDAHSGRQPPVAR